MPEFDYDAPLAPNPPVFTFPSEEGDRSVPTRAKVLVDLLRFLCICCDWEYGSDNTIVTVRPEHLHRYDRVKDDIEKRFGKFLVS